MHPGPAIAAVARDEASTSRADVAACAVVALLAALPVIVPALVGAVPGHPVSDMSDHVQGAWWWGGEVLSGRFPWHVRGVLYPDGGVLWYPDPIGAAIELLFRPLGPTRAYAAAIAVQCALDGALAWALGRRWLGRPGAFVAGCVAGPSAYLVGLVGSGLAEYVGTWTVTLFVLLALDVAEGRRRWWAAGLALGLATTQSFYYGMFCGVLGLCLAIPAPGEAALAKLKRLLPALALGAVLSVLPIGAIEASLSSPDSVIDREKAPGWYQEDAPGIDLVSFVAPMDYYHPDTQHLGNPGVLPVGSLPWAALALAAFGWRDPRTSSWRRGALAWGLLALGPTLVVFHATITVLGHPVPLPGRLLWFPGSPFRYVHHPYRMIAGTLPLLGLLAGAGLERLATRRRAREHVAAGVAGLLVVGQAFLLSPAPFPWPATEPSVPAVYAKVPPGPVLDLPADLREPNRMYVLWATETGRPVPYGVNHWLSRTVREDPQTRVIIGPLSKQERRRNRDVPAQEAAYPEAVDHGGLAGLGFVAVVVHQRYLSGDLERKGLVQRLTAVFGPGTPVRGEDTVWWPVPPADTSKATPAEK